MKVLRDPIMGEFWIDEKAGKVWHITRSPGRKGKEKISKMRFKGFKHEKEAYEYLSSVFGVSVWKLRGMVRDEEI